LLRAAKICIKYAIIIAAAISTLTLRPPTTTAEVSKLLELMEWAELVAVAGW